MAQRNFARGAPPPSHSWEWVGSATPPSPQQQKIPVIVATMTETIVVEKKPKRLLPLLAGGGLGFLAGWYVGRR